HPATHKILPLGGRVGERAGAASEIAIPRFLKRTLSNYVNWHHSTSVRPELVEGPYFSSRKEQIFDKLSPNGGGM
ncbi:hypothetical protein, partial [Sphingobium aromaticivastans]|uniref:hypothetical protein n=1 Tax=Sphingobium aromaticivastans TaxID=1778665 RepID=UPI003018F72C